MNFLGFVTLGQTLYADVITRNTSRVPTNGDSLPTFRIYGPNGLVTTGTVAFRNTGSVTGATNASPIQITSVAHGLTTGTRVTLVNVGGNSAANGTFVITRISADVFSLDGSSGSGSYTSGGTWQVSGLYLATQVVSAGNGFETGKTYSMLVSYAVSSTSLADLYRFIAV